jgi:hypothetical protein
MSKLSTQAKPMPLAAPVTTTCLREVANMNCLSIRIAGHTLVSTNVAAGLANTGGQLGLAVLAGETNTQDCRLRAAWDAKSVEADILSMCYGHITVFQFLFVSLLCLQAS